MRYVCSKMLMQRFKYEMLLLSWYFAKVLPFASSHSSLGIIGGQSVFCPFSMHFVKYLASAIFQKRRPSIDCISFPFIPCLCSRASMLAASSLVWVRMQMLPCGLFAVSSLRMGWYKWIGCWFMSYARCSTTFTCPFSLLVEMIGVVLILWPMRWEKSFAASTMFCALR